MLVHAFVVNDFTVAYASPATRTTQLPRGTAAATWGRSLLAAAVVLLMMAGPGGGGVQPAGAGGYRRPGAMVMGMVCAGFRRSSCSPLRPVRPHAAGLSRVEGARPEPAAAGPGGWIFHLPLLRTWAMSASVAFALRHIAALLRRLGQRVHPFCSARGRWRRVFLTLGIVLGSAWAFRHELGWAAGGSGTRRGERPFMPWLAGTALLHSLAAPISAPASRRGFAAVHLRLLVAPSVGHLPRAPGVLVSVRPPLRTRRAECLSLRRCWSPAARRVACRAGTGALLRVNNTLWSRESLLLGNNVLLMATATCW